MAELTDEQLMAIANSKVQIPGNPATTISARQNNPGNIKFSPNDPYSVGAGAQGFSVYRSPDEGYAALQDLIDRFYKPKNLTIAQMGEIYAPRFENNTDNWIKTVSQISGAKPNTPINQISTPDLARAIVAIESSTRIPSSQPTLNLPQGPSDEELMAIAGKGQPKPQPGKVQSIPEILGPHLTPETFGQAVSNKTIPSPPPSLESILGVKIPTKPSFMTGDFMQPPPVPNVAGEAPVMTSIAGGELARRLGGPLAAPVGAGLGYVTGQAGQNLYKGIIGEEVPSIADQLKQYGKGFITGAGGWMGGEAGGTLMGKVLSPFEKTTAERMANLPAVAEAQKLVEAGAPISPSEIAGTRTSRFFEKLAEKVWPASSIMAKNRNALQGVAEGLKDEFVASRGLYDISKKTVGDAWDNWVQMAGGPDAIYAMPETTATLTDAMGKPFAKKGTFWTKHAATFLEEANNGQATIQGIRNLFNTLSPWSARGAERTAHMKIADAIVKDLSTIGDPEIVAALSAAREAAYLNRVAAPLRNIFNQSMVEPTKAGDTVAFSPSKFVNIWNQRRPTFIDNKNYSPSDIQAIDKFADKMRALIPDLKKGAEFTTPTSLGGLGQLNLENPLAVGGLIYKQPLVAVPVGLDAWLAHSLMSPNGMMRKFLTTGIKPPTLPFTIGAMEEMKND